ncbi:MAG: hypothetical protein KC516_02140 [Nanoarchaeota archaeon]|nr:hypothetical protein [Nanoarchaeota archaeon]
MKTWIVLGTIFVLVLAAGIFVSANGFQSNQEQTDTVCEPGSCPYAATGGCTANNNCGLAGCQAAAGGSCGCGR